MFQCSFTTVTNKVTYRGSENRPAQRSVTARLRNKSLDGGCSEQSLRRATRTKTFPRDAVMARKAFKTAINVNWPCIAVALCGEQYRY